MTGLVVPEPGPTAPRHRPPSRDEADSGDRAAAAVVVELRGELDGAADAEVDTLLEALAGLPQPVLIDVSAAWSSSGVVLTRLVRFRAARQAAGSPCRLRGLHSGITAELADADLAEVFTVWADTVRGDAHHAR